MSAHIVRIKRSATDVRFCTAFGKGDVLGMDNVTEQLKTVPAELGQIVAAINGDFYYRIKGYEGRTTGRASAARGGRQHPFGP